MNGVVQNDAWREEYNTLKEQYTELKRLKEEVKKLEKSCFTSSQKQLKKLSTIKKQLSKGTSGQEVTAKEVTEVEESLKKIRETLPQPNNLFLRSIVGSINVTIPNSEDKLVYKERYENFKRNVTIVICILSLLAIWIRGYTRLPEFILQFVSAWFYLALTVREQILIRNGSKISTWWVLHHYFSIAIAGIFLIWPEGECYRNFQMQFLYFTLTISGIMYLQFIYQKGQLYKLRTLGRAHQMDFVQDAGMRSRSMGDLYFLVPFLLYTYVFQLANSYRLYNMYYMQECQTLWQVPILGVLFFIVALGNTWTLALVLVRKYNS
ncbi:ion channel TACAN-like [Dysidea avara]|uniref:ion channel TACAN-like n=1 Tax=Dysidea avara TaxID=196820 RepID=UPI00331FF7D6